MDLELHYTLNYIIAQPKRVNFLLVGIAGANEVGFRRAFLGRPITWRWWEESYGTVAIQRVRVILLRLDPL